MPTIINIRGTGGAGKSTLVRRVMDCYASKYPNYAEKRSRPLSYRLDNGRGVTPLYVPGHYETPTGGCDTLDSLDQVFDLVTRANQLGFNVLYEGIMPADDVSRTVALSKTSRLTVILLTTTIEDCLASIRTRREEKAQTFGKEVKPLNEKNTRARHESHKRHIGRLMDSGVTCKRLDREMAFLHCRELLGV